MKLTSKAINPVLLCLSLLSKSGVCSPATDLGDAPHTRRDPPTPIPIERPVGAAEDGTAPSRQCDCHAPPESEGRNGVGGGRIAYLLAAHNQRTLDDALHLFRAIRYPSVIVVIHVDKKVDWEGTYLASALRYEVEDCPCGADVYADSIYSPEWGEWSMNDPTHWAMDVLVSHPRFQDRWDVFINVSGDTMPVLAPDVMARLFHPESGPLRETNFVTSASCETGLVPTNVWDFPEKWHKRVHYTHDYKGKFVGDPVVEYIDDGGSSRTKTMTTYFGSQWMALTYEFVSYLVQSLKRDDSLVSRYKQSLIDSERLMADETFVPTILMNVYPFNETVPDVLPSGGLASLPSMYAMRYERMDEHFPTAFGLFPIQQRYDVPDSSLCDKPRVWGPYFLGVYDFSNIRRSGALFIRKVSVHLDANIVRILPVRDHADLPDIQWPEELKVSKKRDWAEMTAKMNEEKSKEVGTPTDQTAKNEQRANREDKKFAGDVREEGPNVDDRSKGEQISTKVNESAVNPSGKVVAPKSIQEIGVIH